VLKLSRSLTAVNAVLNSVIMNMTADKPLILFSFFEILALIAFSCGTFSAFTKFCASEATSTPEPALSDVNIFCALALLAAEICAAVIVVPVVVLLELTGVVAIGCFEGGRQWNRYLSKKLESITSIDVIEQTQLGNLGKAALRSLQRQLVFVHLGDGFGVVQVLDV